MSVVGEDRRSRWTELAAVDNVRDLGGLPVEGGGSTRFGVAFRASTPQQATTDDVALLVDGLGIRTLLDLRLPDEAAREGHGLLGEAGLSVVNLPVRKGDSTVRDVVMPDTRKTDLGLLYEQLLAGSAASIVTAARNVADPARHGVVFHCAAGKDRTGVLAAVLLDAVGVTAEAIVEDYALTAEREHRVRERLIRIPAYSDLPPVAEGVMGVKAAAIRRFVETLRATHGGAAEFLLRHGLAEDELAALRDALVTPPTSAAD
ncbi:tyrosine-protein phosphatase [Nocardioides sp. NPDC057577]|uniref:tyrosine-protein phosphatase n=1 Tax=Nocardioides sp. NPDC057577 TaxID=3346171 RepID=UPI00366AF7E4